jgi:hypothetical protein
MSAALQVSALWASAAIDQTPEIGLDHDPLTFSVPSADLESSCPAESLENVIDEPLPEISLAFYRKHTEKMLRRYLYASMLVGRTPAILGEPVARGWVSNHRIKTFEDAVIFVLDVERCLNKLRVADRALLSRIAIQEYTHLETASLLRLGVRTVAKRYPIALDRLTELLLAAGLLMLPKS